MITEDYINFEVAKLLKEKGFEPPHDYRKCMPIMYTDKGEIKWGVWSDDWYPRITLQMAMKWLEEKYGVFCVIRRHGDIDRGFTYSWNWEGRIGLSMKTEGGFVSAKEAREAAIKYCLENLI